MRTNVLDYIISFLRKIKITLKLRLYSNKFLQSINEINRLISRFLTLKTQNSEIEVKKIQNDSKVFKSKSSYIQCFINLCFPIFGRTEYRSRTHSLKLNFI